MWEGKILKALLLRHRFDIVSITLGNWIKTYHGVAMDWWMLPGWCCIAIAALELGNGDSWYHMCAFRFHFWGRKVNWNQASHVRASSVPTLYACCLTKRSCHFLFVARVGLCCWFCDFAVSFLVPPDGSKNGTVKVLFFCCFTSGACGPKMGPPGGPIFGCGEPRFPHCAVCLPGWFLPYQSYGWYNVIIFPATFQFDELTCWSPTVPCFCRVLLVFCCGFCVFCVFGCCFGFG